MNTATERSESMHVELCDCENTILREIGAKEAKRRDIAQTYHLILHSSERNEVDWSKINGAIIERWSISGLNWIKTQAWSGKCFEART